MIKCWHLIDEKREASCNNCKRFQPLMLVYSFVNDKTSQSSEMRLCEDCSSAIGRLHFKVMEQGKPHKYDMDEIMEDD